MTYFVVFWGIASCTMEGPFGDEESAKSYLAEYEPTELGGNGEAECGIVVGPLPTVGEMREF